MKTLKTLGGIVFVLVFLLFGFILGFVPKNGHVDKSIVINAPASAIFPYLNDFKKANAWSPWTKMDPEAKQIYEGAEAGVGAKMSWDGPSTGKGAEVITEVIENQKIRIALTFDGQEGTVWADFLLSEEETGTKVTWTYDGDNNGFTGKAKWIIGGYFVRTAYESGLKDLKQLVESVPAAEPVQKPVLSDSTSVK
jgi:hypothetical protein